MHYGKHTQGPWTVVDRSSSFLKSVVAVTNDNFTSVCDVGSEENAAIIAAAPEMLEALELANTLLMVLDEHVAEENEHVLEQIQSAIRKARGEK